MMRIARVVLVLLPITFCAAAVAQAQPAGSSDMPGYAEFNAGATLGHKSDLSVGGEAGYQVMPNIDVFGEVGHIGNAASADLEARANTIANNVGATASVIAKVNYFDAGIRYRFTIKQQPNLHPYVSVGVGAARVSTETTLSINGTTVPEGTLVTFGTDLNGSHTAAFLMFGGGTTVPFRKRYFVDVSYRFGRVFEKSETIGSDTVTVLNAFNTHRVQVGLGIKF
jgi:opacity protein-like surface antigen